MLRRSWTGSTVHARRGRRSVIGPASGSIIRLIIRIVVVLPQPDGPISTQTSPSGTVSVSAIDRRPRRAREALGQRDDLDHRRAQPSGRQCALQAAEQEIGRRSASSVAGIAPTSSCGNAIIAMPAVMKSPSPPPPMYAASTAPDTTCTAAVRIPAKITGSAIGSSTLRTISAARHPHAARGVDDVRIDLRIAVYGVDQDRRQREQRQREQRRREAGAEQRHRQREDRERRQRAADVRGVDGDQAPRAAAGKPHADRNGDGDRDARAPRRRASTCVQRAPSRNRPGCASMNAQASASSMAGQAASRRRKRALERARGRESATTASTHAVIAPVQIFGA